MKKLKYFIASALLAVLMLVQPYGVMAQTAETVFGEDETITFTYGSNISPTDLFLDFGAVMPGDTLEQKILLKSSAKYTEVKVSMRSLGAVEGEDFLKQMNLVVKDQDGKTLFDSTADQKAQLEDWTTLTSLKPGKEFELTAVLSVPLSMSNEHQNTSGKIDWEFMEEEVVTTSKTPSTTTSGSETSAQTGILLFGAGLLLAAVILAVLGFRKKKQIR